MYWLALTSSGTSGCAVKMSRQWGMPSSSLALSQPHFLLPTCESCGVARCRWLTSPRKTGVDAKTNVVPESTCEEVGVGDGISALCGREGSDRCGRARDDLSHARRAASQTRLAHPPRAGGDAATRLCRVEHPTNANAQRAKRAVGAAARPYRVRDADILQLQREAFGRVRLHRDGQAAVGAEAVAAKQ